MSWNSTYDQVPNISICCILSQHCERIILNNTERFFMYFHFKTTYLRTRHAGHSWRSKDELISDVLLWTPSHGRAKAGRLARTYTQKLSPIWDVTLKTCRKQWTMGKDGERRPGISVLMAWNDDDNVKLETGNWRVSYQHRRTYHSSTVWKYWNIL